MWACGPDANDLVCPIGPYPEIAAYPLPSDVNGHWLGNVSLRIGDLNLLGYSDTWSLEGDTVIGVCQGNHDTTPQPGWVRANGALAWSGRVTCDVLSLPMCSSIVITLTSGSIHGGQDGTITAIMEGLAEGCGVVGAVRLAVNASRIR